MDIWVGILLVLVVLGTVGFHVFLALIWRQRNWNVWEMPEAKGFPQDRLQEVVLPLYKRATKATRFIWLWNTLAIPLFVAIWWSPLETYQLAIVLVFLVGILVHSARSDMKTMQLEYELTRLYLREQLAAQASQV